MRGSNSGTSPLKGNQHCNIRSSQPSTAFAHPFLCAAPRTSKPRPRDISNPPSYPPPHLDNSPILPRVHASPITPSELDRGGLSPREPWQKRCGTMARTERVSTSTRISRRQPTPSTRTSTTPRTTKTRTRWKRGTTTSRRRPTVRTETRSTGISRTTWTNCKMPFRDFETSSD